MKQPTEVSDTIVDAVRTLIGATRRAEAIEGDGLKIARLRVDIDLDGGGHETWLITVARAGSEH